MWQYPTLLLCNWLTWIWEHTGKMSKSCRQTVRCAVWLQYSECLLSLKNEPPHFVHFLWETDKRTNGFCRDAQALSLLDDQTTAVFCKQFLLSHPSNPTPALSNPYAASRLPSLRFGRHVICNGNGKLWVKLALCQNVILPFQPGCVTLILLFIQNQIRSTVTEPP